MSKRPPKDNFDDLRRPKKGRPEKVDKLELTEEDLKIAFPEVAPGVPVAGLKQKKGGPTVYKDDLQFFRAWQIKYLEKYIETFDHWEASKHAGIKPAEVKRCKHSGFLKALANVNHLMRLKWKKKIQGTEMIRRTDRVEEMMEEAYTGGDGKTAASLASTMIKGTEASMRASGEFVNKETGPSASISVNINIGGKDEAETTIDGDAIEVDVDD